MDARDAKAHLRSALKNRRDSLTKDQQENEAKKILPLVLSLPAWKNSQTVCLYASFAGELPTQSLLIATLQSGKKLLLPRVNPNHQPSLHVVDDLSKLTLSPLGIFEPSETAPRMSPLSVDFFLVPGIAFDRHGNRLGHGSGFYDRLLAEIKSDAFCLGYAHNFQLVPSIPHEAHDKKVHAIATPSGIIEAEPAS